MKKDIPEIINSALGLEKNLLKEYFELHQKESGLKPELFIEFVLVEIKERKKKINTDFSRIDEEKYHYSIDYTYQVADLAGRMRLAAGLIVLEDFLKKQLHLLRKTNKNSSGPIWTPDEGLTSKVLPPFIRSDKLDGDYSDQVKFLEKISEEHLKEDLKIDDAINDTKKNGFQGQGMQKPFFENKFNKMPIEEVRRFFTPLIESKNRANQYWMTNKNFDIFLRRSFCKEKLNKPEINFSSSEKGCIIKLFYKFYTKSKKKREITSILKKPYVELLENAFNTEAFFNLHTNNFSDRANCDWMIDDE